MLEASKQKHVKKAGKKASAPKKTSEVPDDTLAAMGKGSQPVDPLQALLELESPTVDDLVETLMTWAQASFGSDEVIAACEDFYAATGKVFHDDAFYESRINYFFDHFLFERVLPPNKQRQGAITPFGVFLSRCQAEEIALPGELQQRFESLVQCRHSVFQVLKVREHGLVVRDLLNQRRYQISAKADEIYRGFEKRDIFQSFLFPNGDVAHLSQGVVLHPPRAVRILKRYIKTSQKSPEFAEDQLLSRLARQQIRYMRHRHVDAKLIYQADPR